MHRLTAARAGYVQELRAEHIGRAAVALGAGRSRLEDTIDHGVGIEVVAPVGTYVRDGDTVLILRHREGRGFHAALPLITAAVTVTDEAPRAQTLVVERVH